MRKIEKAIIEEVQKAINQPALAWTKNFSKKDAVEVEKEQITYYLYNIPVVRVFRKRGPIHNVLMFTAHGWHSNTIKSRINAFVKYFYGFSGVHQVNFMWYWFCTLNITFIFKDYDMLYISPIDGTLQFARGNSRGEPQFPYNKVFAEEDQK